MYLDISVIQWWFSNWTVANDPAHCDESSALPGKYNLFKSALHKNSTVWHDLKSHKCSLSQGIKIYNFLLTYSLYKT